MPKMGVDPEKLKAPKPAPAGWYKLKFKGFKPKYGKNDKSAINFNGEFEIVEANKDDDGKKVFIVLSTKFERALVDFSHGLGFPMNADGTFVGNWTFDPKDVENVEKAQYSGPLLGKTCKAELIIDTYQGNENNKIKQFVCAIDGCATKFPDIKHITNLIGNK